MSNLNSDSERERAESNTASSGAPLPPDPAGARRGGSLLQVRDLCKSFDRVVANDSVSMDVARGSIVGLIGPNGSGKTTLFHSIVGLHPVDQGEVWFDGREITRMTMAETARIGLVRTFQQSHVFDRLSCIDNLRICVPRAGEEWLDMLRALPRELEQRGLELLDFVGLYPVREVPVGELSYGQRKLLELAMALMSRPRLLLLDEPTAGVSPVMINGIMDRLQRVNAEMGVTLLIIEHNLRVVMSLAQRIYCLAAGRVLAAGTPPEVRGNPRVVEAYLGKLRASGDWESHADRALRGSDGGVQPRFVAGVATLVERRVDVTRIEALAGPHPALRVEGLVAGYHRREVLHGVDLGLGAGQAACVIGPNGAGKSTLLHAICGLASVGSGRVTVAGRDVTRLAASAMLRDARLAHVMQDTSVFPDMTVEQNLVLGGHLLRSRARARQAAEEILDRYPVLAARRGYPARTLSGGERRMLELVRSLIMRPRVLLVDEPSIGLAARFVDQIFGVLADLKQREGIAILMVEQNAAMGLEFADVGYVMVNGKIAMAGRGDDLLRDPEVGMLFLGS